MEVKLEKSWKEELKSEFSEPYFHEIVRLLKAEKALGKTIYPPGPLIFNAFELTPFDKVKVVIIGQDPYHGPGQAEGLCFSVPSHIAPPPSLKNIFKELRNDIGINAGSSGSLADWAKQGVLLLNASLTVRQSEPNSHGQIGWSRFTDAVITTISEKKTGIVFLLWGKFAQDKISMIDESKHFILKAAHPSPFSADKGFFGCGHFSKTNEILISQKKDPIDWSIK